jgi:hypothetical protein
MTIRNDIPLVEEGVLNRWVNALREGHTAKAWMLFMRYMELINA